MLSQKEKKYEDEQLIKNNKNFLLKIHSNYKKNS